MFNRKLKDRISELEKKIDSFPEIKYCLECKQIKLMNYFFDSERYKYAQLNGNMNDNFYNNYCSDCAPKMKLKEVAKNIAEANPEMVIACNKKKGKK